MAGQAIMGEGAQGSPANVQQSTTAPAQERGRAAGQVTRNVGHGVSGFFKPFKTVGGKILLEVVSVFFLLPAIAFAPG
jgi:hypothetical protein